MSKMTYEKPMMYCEEFVPNQFIAGCDLNIVSGDMPVKVYCCKTSYITVFTAGASCTYQREPFTSVSAAEDFFSHLFQWGNVAEATNGNNKLDKWTNAQKLAAEKEINNGWATLPGTIVVGSQGKMVHAGYAIDYLTGDEGKPLS